MKLWQANEDILFGELIDTIIYEGKDPTHYSDKELEERLEELVQ